MAPESLDGTRMRVEDAYLKLKGDILENRLPPGYLTPEPELALALGMSRTPVREALVRLASEGLVQLVPRRGVRVLPVSPADMKEIYQLLGVLEPEAAARIAERGLSEEQRSRLEQATDAMERALGEGDLDAWALADNDFHHTLLALSDNARLKSIVGNLFAQSHRARAVTLRLREPPWKSTGDHRAILQSMADGNAELTRSLFLRHRREAADELLAILKRFQLSHL